MTTTTEIKGNEATVTLRGEFAFTCCDCGDECVATLVIVGCDLAADGTVEGLDVARFEAGGCFDGFDHAGLGLTSEIEDATLAAVEGPTAHARMAA